MAKQLDHKHAWDAALHEDMQFNYAQASPRARRYAICTKGIDMTCLGIELERLERVGVAKEITKRWHDRAWILLNDILDASDGRDDGEPKNLPVVERRLLERQERGEPQAGCPAGVHFGLAGEDTDAECEHGWIECKQCEDLCPMCADTAERAGKGE